MITIVSICLYFQVHQPFRLRNYTVFDIGNNHHYFDAKKNEAICKKVAQKCYLPTNLLLFELIKKLNGRVKIAFSISGVAIEQFQLYAPRVIQSFKQLAQTGCVEFLSETYYHSLAALQSKQEFILQIQQHQQLMEQLFAQTPTVFRNTELLFNNKLAQTIQELGYKGILAEGTDHILQGRSPHFLYKIFSQDAASVEKIKVLLKDYRLSDDIAFRFSNKSWEQWPLTAEKFTAWINEINGRGDVVNLFMDYETFGEHQWKDSGIFSFLQQLPVFFLHNPHNEFLFPSEVVQKYTVKDTIDVPQFVSWADIERDTSAWLGNEIQKAAFKELYSVEKMITEINPEMNNKKLLDDWRRLQTSDHFYYMCTKYFADGDVHKYFNPYESPYDAFIIFMNIMKDIKLRIKEGMQEQKNIKEEKIVMSN